MLVLRALGLGDTLTAVAPLRGVRRAWPGSRVLLAGPADAGALLQREGLVDAVLPASGLSPLPWPQLALSGVDGGHVAVNLHGRGPQSHRVLQATSPGRLVAFRCAEAGHTGGPAWHGDEHEVDRWCRMVSSAGGRCSREELLLGDPPPPPAAVAALVDVSRVVVVHPGAASGSRRWPVERWVRVVAALAARGHPVAVTGGAGERGLTAAVAGGASRPGVLDLGGRLTVAELAGLVGRCRLLLCGDTGVAHLATAWSTPSVLLFGPVPPRWWGPAVEPHLHVVLRPGREGDPPGDPHADSLDPVLARTTVDEVVDAADRLLSATGAATAASGQ